MDMAQFHEGLVVEGEKYDALECHMNWVKTAENLTTLKKRHDSWLEDNKLDPSIPFQDGLTHQIIDALLAEKAGEYQLAVDILNEAFKMTEDVGVDELGKRKAYQFVILANKMLISIRGDLPTSGIDFAQLGDDCSKSNVLMAAILALKGALFGLMGDYVPRLMYYRKVVQLEPDAPDYLEMLYSAMRKKRKELDPLAPPPEEEIDLIEKAYSLSPKSANVLRSRSALFLDLVRAKMRDAEYTTKFFGPGLRVGVTELKFRSKESAMEAFQLNPYSILNALQLGDILMSITFGPEDIRVAELHFKHVWKLGPTIRLFCIKLESFSLLTPKDAGIECLERSMELAPENHSATMDYLRNQYNRLEFHELMEILDEKLPFFIEKKRAYATILCLKAGIFICKYQEVEALDIWLKAYEVFPPIIDRKSNFLASGTFPELVNEYSLKSMRNYIQYRFDVEPEESSNREIFQNLFSAAHPTGAYPAQGMFYRRRKVRPERDWVVAAEKAKAEAEAAAAASIPPQDSTPVVVEAAAVAAVEEVDMQMEELQLTE